MMRTSLFLGLFLAALLGGIQGFAPSPKLPVALESASSLQMTILTYNGKKKNFRAGSPLKNAVSGLGVKVTYSCRK